MMDKRGQITIFIIIGVLIFLILLGIFLIQGIFTKEKLETASEGTIVSTAPVKQFVESCLQNQIEDAAFLIAAQGGYFHPPLENFPIPLTGTDLELIIPFQEGDNFPDAAFIENELALAVKDFWEPCFDFSRLAMDVTAEEEGTVEIKLNPHFILAEVERSLTIKKDGASAVMKHFVLRVASPLGEAHQAARNILAESSCLSCLPSLLPEGFTVNELVIPTDEDVILVRTLTNGEIVFNFAERVPYQELSEEADSSEENIPNENLPDENILDENILIENMMGNTPNEN